MQQIGRYEIERELGRGAMGVVYLARDTRIGRSVALKTIRLSDFADAEKLQRLRERLNREAQSAGILSHENIVTIYDVDEQEGLSYISMEFVEGDSLERLLEKRREFSREMFQSLMRQMAAALDFAHSRGIVHRDIKPANVMVTPHGRVKITDFGVAKVTHASSMTQGGAMLGTPDYMSPEQIDGRGVDGRADQFSLAVIAFEILTGEKPFVAETLPALFYRIAHEQSPDATLLNPSLSQEIGSVLRKALAKKSDARFESCLEFVNALGQACATSPGWHALPRGMSQTLPTMAEPPAARKTTEDAARPEAGTQEHIAPHSSAATAGASGGGVMPPPIPVNRLERKEEAASYGGGFITGESPDRLETVEMPGPAQDDWLRQARREEEDARKRKRRNLLIALVSLLVVLGALGIAYFGTDLFRATSPAGGETAGTTPEVPEGEETAGGAAQGDATETGAGSAETTAESSAPGSGSRDGEELASNAQADSTAASPPPEAKPSPAKPAAPPRPAERLSTVRFISEPAGARVIVDASSSLACETPCSLQLPVGRHTYSMRLSQYRNEIKLIEVGPVGETVSVKLERRVGLVRVTSNPTGAAIYVNGTKRSEVTPATLRLPPGSYQIRVEKDGSMLEQDVSVQEDAAVQVQANLQ